MPLSFIKCENIDKRLLINEEQNTTKKKEVVARESLEEGEYIESDENSCKEKRRNKLI